MDNQTEELFGQTPWQTVGPFFHYSLPWRGAADLSGQSGLGARPELLAPGHDHLPQHNPGAAAGTPITVSGRVLDGGGQPVADALLELWQADAGGVYRDSYVYFGRCATDVDGVYRFHTVRPGAVTGHDGEVYAPHISLGIFARGVIKRLLTRVYFADAPENARDPILNLVPAARRPTLLAALRQDELQFNVNLQGESETVFFQC